MSGGGWLDPIVGGTALRIPAIRSPNYIAGSSGWTINQDGSVEFNNGTFRGTVTAGTFQGTNFVINSTGAFFYSGTPALNNLIVSIANAAGTDAYGNDYLSGVTTYDESANDLFTQLNAGGITIGNIIPAGGPDTADAGLIVSGITGITNSLTIRSVVEVTPNTDAAQVTLVAGAPSATTGQPGVPRVELFDVAGSSPCDLWTTGSVVKLSGPDSPYTWQDPTSLLGTGWAIGPNSGTVQKLQYRKDALDNLVLVGSVHSTSATPAATLFTLPSGYRPAITQRVVCVSNAAGTPTIRFVEINSNGGVLIMNNLTATSTDVYINACVPFGHIG